MAQRDDSWIVVQGYDEFKTETPLETLNTMLITIKVGPDRGSAPSYNADIYAA